MNPSKLLKIFCLATLLSLNAASLANEVEIVDVKAHQSANKTWTFAVTLKHADTGWDHYANEWQVLTKDNKVLATRTLHHPHVDEQPFTRNTSGVKIPKGIETVRIIAKDTVHSTSKNAVEINLATKELTTIVIALPSEGADKAN